MPSYAFMAERAAKLHNIENHMKVLRGLGVPYTDEMIKMGRKDAAAQAIGIARTDISGLQSRYGEKVNARDFDGNPAMISEMDALVAYLQVLGTMVDFEAAKDVEGTE